MRINLIDIPNLILNCIHKLENFKPALKLGFSRIDTQQKFVFACRKFQKVIFSLEKLWVNFKFGY